MTVLFKVTLKYDDSITGLTVTPKNSDAVWFASSVAVMKMVKLPTEVWSGMNRTASRSGRCSAKGTPARSAYPSRNTLYVKWSWYVMMSMSVN